MSLTDLLAGPEELLVALRDLGLGSVRQLQSLSGETLQRLKRRLRHTYQLPWRTIAHLTFAWRFVFLMTSSCSMCLCAAAEG